MGRDAIPHDRGEFENVRSQLLSHTGSVITKQTCRSILPA